MEGGGSGLPVTTVAPSGNTDGGRCPLDHPSEFLTKASLLLLSIIKYRYEGCSAPCCGTLLILGCWVRALACDSERFGRCGKFPTNSTKNLTSYDDMMVECPLMTLLIRLLQLLILLTRWTVS